MTEPDEGEGEQGEGKAPQPPEATPKPALVKKDSIEETLICQICQVCETMAIQAVCRVESSVLFHS